MAEWRTSQRHIRAATCELLSLQVTYVKNCTYALWPVVEANNKCWLRSVACALVGLINTLPRPAEVSSLGFCLGLTDEKSAVCGRKMHCTRVAAATLHVDRNAATSPLPRFFPLPTLNQSIMQKLYACEWSGRQPIKGPGSLSQLFK